MAQVVQWYGAGLMACLRSSINLESDTIKATLHTSSYSPNLDTDDFYNDATNELATASGYTSGGVTLTSKVLGYNPIQDQVLWDFDDFTWTFTASVSFRYIVLRKARGGASSADELIAYIDLGSTQTISGTYTFILDLQGLLYLDIT